MQSGRALGGRWDHGVTSGPEHATRERRICLRTVRGRPLLAHSRASSCADSAWGVCAAAYARAAPSCGPMLRSSPPSGPPTWLSNLGKHLGCVAPASVHAAQLMFDHPALKTCGVCANEKLSAIIMCVTGCRPMNVLGMNRPLMDVIGYPSEDWKTSPMQLVAVAAIHRVCQVGHEAGACAGACVYRTFIIEPVRYTAKQHSSRCKA